MAQQASAFSKYANNFSAFKADAANAADVPAMAGAASAFAESRVGFEGDVGARGEPGGILRPGAKRTASSQR